MATTQQDVKLVYGGGGGTGSIIATPPGSSLNGVIQSGFPAFQGVAQPVADLFLDFNDGTDVDTLGINIAGATTGSSVDNFNNTKIYRKHEWIPTGGFDGGGFMRMHWFTGMGIGFSPVWVTAPGGFTPHYLLNYKVRQSATMVHAGSAVKLLRQFSVDGYRLGTMEWDDQGLGAGQSQRLKWFYDGFAISPPATPNKSNQTFCAWDDVNDPGSGCSPKGPGGLIDGNWHDFQIECDYRDPEASLISISIDGILISPSPLQLNPESQADQAGNLIPPLGSVLQISPFAEMYSCGQSGCQATINTGDYDVDHFAYTILP